MCPKNTCWVNSQGPCFAHRNDSTKSASAPGEIRHGWALHSRLDLLLRCLSHYFLNSPSFRSGGQSPTRRIHALSSEECAVTLPHLSILPIQCTQSSNIQLFISSLSHKPLCCESIWNSPLHTAHLSNIWHFPHGLWSHPQASDSRDPVILWKVILYHHRRQVTTCRAQLSRKAT